jgi:peptide/nickel transport system permease protein
MSRAQTRVERALLAARPLLDLRIRLAWLEHINLLLGALLVLAAVVMAIFANWIAPYSPFDLDTSRMLQPPGPQHLLGTDEVGRDILSRVIFAARISLEVSTISVGIGLTLGVIVGATCALYGGVADMALMRLMDILYSFPAILLAIAIMAGLGTSIVNAMIAIGIIFIPGFARLARATALIVIKNQYIDSARAIGMTNRRILVREILPNIAAPLIVQATVALAYATITESALSFLGLGAQPPDPSWGNMLSTGRGFIAVAPWMTLAPGGALFCTSLGFNLLGDGLRDLLDPRQRQ